MDLFLYLVHFRTVELLGWPGTHAGVSRRVFRFGRLGSVSLTLQYLRGFRFLPNQDNQNVPKHRLLSEFDRTETFF